MAQDKSIIIIYNLLNAHRNALQLNPYIIQNFSNNHNFIAILKRACRLLFRRRLYKYLTLFL